MSEPISIDILSDEDGPEHDVSSPFPSHSKRQRTEPLSSPAVLLIDDDPTPRKPEASTSTPSFVPETPMCDLSNSVAIVKCTTRVCDPHKFSGISGFICLESDNESENGCERKQNEALGVALDSELSSRLVVEDQLQVHENLTEMSRESSSKLIFSEDGITQLNDILDEGTDGLEPEGNIVKQKNRSKVNANKKKDVNERSERMKPTKEQKKQLREQEKLQKAALKAEAAEMKRLQKEKQKWEKGKFALKSIVAEIDTRIVEGGSVGGHLLTKLAEKGLQYRITSNPIERSIVWNMEVPEEISLLSSSGVEIPYVLLVFEAEEFCNLLLNESFMDHVSCVRNHYPSHTICYITNRLMAYINKREQGQYKNPASYSGWRRPPVEEVFSRLITHFAWVHSRQCIDEAELAEHVVGLTCSLASCQFRKKLTRLSVNANGSLVPKDCVDKNLIKKNLWLKALIAIPKVQPRFAIAIWKKYPTMRSLLTVYMDPNKSGNQS
ncbi:hypothetical protein NMG60_11007162 [Bertholletia excelsa]